jgi:hypothetical protein
VAHFAKQFSFMLGAVCRVEHLVAQAAFEAGLVKFLPTSETLLSSVHGLAALWALWVIWRLEWHVG